MHLLFKALRVLSHHKPRTPLMVLAPIVPRAPHLTLTSICTCRAERQPYAAAPAPLRVRRRARRARSQPRRRLPQVKAARPLRVDPRAPAAALAKGGRGGPAEREASVRAAAASLQACHQGRALLRNLDVVRLPVQLVG
eukprot:scaffold5008_cov69-Phaeocystis_antarctica.AAC.7